MAKNEVELLTFNRGVVSPLALARTDIKRVAMSAQEQTNFIPRVLGPMSLRPGFQYIGNSKSNLKAFYLPFIFATDDTAILELTDLALRVRVNEVLVTRPSVSTVLTNGVFAEFTDVVTTTIANPCVLTYTSAQHTYVNDEPVYLTTSGALPNGGTTSLVSGTVYYVRGINTGAKTMNLALTPGGANISTLGGTQSGTHTIHPNYEVTGWVDVDETGTESKWLAGNSLALLGTGTARAIRTQTITTSGVDQSSQHALVVTITQGECILRVGSTSGGSDYIVETTLRPGVHSLAFTPIGASIFIRLSASTSYPTIVKSCVMAPSGVMEIPTPWGESVLSNMRARQSGDVIYVACRGVTQKRIERRGPNSWSVVDYVANLGPFRVGNSTTITLTPSALSGSITLTASDAVFKTTNVGGLYAIDSTGQAVSKIITSADVYSDPIRVSGIGAGRVFGITITGTWVATVTLQRSVGAPGAWVDVSSYTVNQSTTLNDTLDNQIIYYRIGVKPAAYTSGTVTASLAYSAGTIRGIARITAFTSELVVSAVVVKDFGALTATTDWMEGSWSTRRGFPSAVGIHEGRVWWAGADKIIGSVSDDFANYDDSVVGDSGPINRSIGTGPVDTINWLLESQQLLMGAQGAELICRSSSLGEPLTPLNFNLKEVTSRGSLGVDAVKVDTSAIFVDRSGSRVYELDYDNVGTTYAASDLTAIVPEIARPGVSRIAVQRRADTRLHFVRTDGTVAILVYDKAEDVKAWVPVVTDGVVEDAFVLPGDEEDRVYYSVARVVNGATVRFLERWAKQSECVGAALNKQADAFVTYTGAATNVITGLGHLEGRTVVCWANTSDMGSFTVSGGQITLLATVTNAVIGLTYRARYRSVKSQYLTKHKKLDKIGLVLIDTHARGVKYGQDYDHMDDMPVEEQNQAVASDYIWTDYEFDNFTLNGTFDPNARLCLEANAPRPCTVAAVILQREINAK